LVKNSLTGVVVRSVVCPQTKRVDPGCPVCELLAWDKTQL